LLRKRDERRAENGLRPHIQSIDDAIREEAMRSESSLRAGDWVEVLSREEILRTLDASGSLEKMPFMPEMLRYAGQRFRVSKRAHRTCDTIDYVGGRHLKRAVHLEDLRCDGSAHGNCEARCLFFWKDAWVKKVDGPGSPGARFPSGDVEPPAEAVLVRGTRKAGEAADASDPTYVCQATALLDATVPLRRSDLEPYLEDLSSRNVGFWQMLKALAFVPFSFLVGGRYGVSTPLIMLYDWFQRLIDGTPYPERRGKVPNGVKTPSRRLDLKPGEMVRVRALPEILETVDEALRNRGLGWHAEMVRTTGRTFRVAARLEKIINEKTGKMIHFKNDVVILEDGICLAQYINNCRRFCPRAVYHFFREIWLDRVPEPVTSSAHNEPVVAAQSD